MFMRTAICNGCNGTAMGPRHLNRCFGPSIKYHHVAIGVAYNSLIVLGRMAGDCATSRATGWQAHEAIAFQSYDPGISTIVPSNYFASAGSESRAGEGC